MPTSLYQVDAFAERPSMGNPAAVCPLEREPGADRMQAVAAEMNLSETAFVWPRGEGFGLRGLIVTARADDGARHDFTSRFFALHARVPATDCAEHD